jgi:predicted peptidase
VALHGAGGPVDQDFEDAVAQDPNFPFILVLPRGRDGGFASSSVRQTLEAELPKYRVDNDRMYITGFSAGAYTAWRVAAGWPERFAAIVLIAGGGLDELACAVKEVPVWLIHNTNDSVVPASESIELADAIRACSGIVTLTLLEAPPGGTGHNAWSQYYRSLSFYDWLLQHRLGEPSATQQFTARAASR